MIADRPYALILLDLMMPRVDGLEVLRRLADVRMERPMVIVMTAAADELVRRLNGHQVQGVIRKPFDAHHLVDLVRGSLAPQP